MSKPAPPVDPRLPKITIGMPIGSGSLPWGTALSLLKTVAACKDEGIELQIESVVGCSVVSWARSGIATSFLNSDSKLLFWIDSDIIWTVDDFFRVVSMMSAHDAVGATYPFKKLNPLSFVLNHDGEPDQYTINGHGLVKIKSIGLGFFCVKRAVMEKLAAGKQTRLDPLNGQKVIDIFRIDHEGEDIAFMGDIRAAGFDCWLDPKISLGHIGPMIYRGNVVEAMGLQDYFKEKK